MSDIAFLFDGICVDMNLSGGDYDREEGLATAVVLSLFTDARVSDEELPVLEKSKRGWWGDMFPEVDQDKIGSRLWTLARRKQTTETLRLAEDYALEALNWMLEDGVASTISATASYIARGQMELVIQITRPDQDNERFSIFWDKQELKGFQQG